MPISLSRVNLIFITFFLASKESCPVRPIPAYKAGLYGLTENRQLSNSNPKPPFIPVHRTGHSGCFSKVHTSELLKQAGKPYPNDGFHHSIQVPSLLKVMPVVDSICRIQSPR